MGDFQALQVRQRIRRHFSGIFHQIFEKEEVRQHGGEQLPVVVPMPGVHHLAVQHYVAAGRRVQPQQQFDQGGLAGAILTDDEKDFALAQREVQRPQGKARHSVLARVLVANLPQFDAFDLGPRRMPGVLQKVGFG
ncbi:hypothetical protein D9M68_850650 [compost metagenome]